MQGENVKVLFGRMWIN